MTSIESLIEQLAVARTNALYGDDASKLRFANLVLGSWHTIASALNAASRNQTGSD